MSNNICIFQTSIMFLSKYLNSSKNINISLLIILNNWNKITNGTKLNSPFVHWSIYNRCKNMNLREKKIVIHNIIDKVDEQILLSIFTNRKRFTARKVIHQKIDCKTNSNPFKRQKICHNNKPKHHCQSIDNNLKRSFNAFQNIRHMKKRRLHA